MPPIPVAHPLQIVLHHRRVDRAAAKQLDVDARSGLRERRLIPRVVAVAALGRRHHLAVSANAVTVIRSLRRVQLIGCFDQRQRGVNQCHPGCISVGLVPNLVGGVKSLGPRKTGHNKLRGRRVFATWAGVAPIALVDGGVADGSPVLARQCAVDQRIHRVLDGLVVRSPHSRGRQRQHAFVGAPGQRILRQGEHEAPVAVGVKAGFIHAVEDVRRRSAQAPLVGGVGAGVALRWVSRIAAGPLFKQHQHRQTRCIARRAWVVKSAVVGEIGDAAINCGANVRLKRGDGLRRTCR